MNKTSFIYATIAFSFSWVLAAQEHEQDRLKHAGEVLTEIVNIPDSIPRGLLDRAECVIVFPSVKKLAFGVGASYGRGAMSCRSGASFTGPWGPAGHVCIGRWQHRISNRGSGNGLRASGRQSQGC